MNKVECALCGNSLQYGPQRYEGKVLKLYGREICCDVCWNGNADGWSNQLEPILLKILESKNLPVPERTLEERLPRGD